VAVLAIALAGCGGDDAADTTDATTDAAPAAATVVAEGIAFTTSSLTVPAGTAVTFENADGVPHTVTSGAPGAETDVFGEDLPAGGTATVTVAEPGTYAYFCQIHPAMTAELVVTG
jgi:plastocyanin